MSAIGSKMSRVVGKLTPSSTTFLLCDIQERFRPLILNGETVVKTAQYLTSIGSELEIPIIATEQYSKVFGPTVTECFANGQSDVDALKSKGRVFEKKKFSMLTDEVMDHIQTEELRDRNSFVLFGIEAHVCVQVCTRYISCIYILFMISSSSQFINDSKHVWIYWKWAKKCMSSVTEYQASSHMIGRSHCSVCQVLGPISQQRRVLHSV